MDKTVETKTINGNSFDFFLEKGANNYQIRCIPEDESLQPLCTIVETSFLYSPINLLNSLLEQHGQSFEGELSFAYYDEYPDELEPGVNIDCFDEELVVSIEMFRLFVIEFVSYYLTSSLKFSINSDFDNSEITALLEELKTVNNGQ